MSGLLQLQKKYSSKKNVTSAKMFGSEALLVKGQVFMAMMKDNLVLKLDQAGTDMALKIKGADFFDPMKNGKKMKQWISIPLKAVDQKCEAVVAAAYQYVGSLPPKKKK